MLTIHDTHPSVSIISGYSWTRNSGGYYATGDGINNYIFGRTDKPQGKLYDYHPKIENTSEEMRQFVEMCFDPQSPMNDRLKQTLLEMLGEAKK